MQGTGGGRDGEGVLDSEGSKAGLPPEPELVYAAVGGFR